MSQSCHHCKNVLDPNTASCHHCNPEGDVEITQVITPSENDDSYDKVLVERSLSDFNVEHTVSGGFATVLKAKDPLLDRVVALKLVPSTNNQSELINEAKLACQLSHPNIVTIHEIIQDSEQLAIVMEWVDGESLKARFNESISIAEKVEIALALCKAIEYAHHHDILHCDIKPDNIMFDKHGQVKVLDFGLAHVLDTDTKTEMTGSPTYFAPECYDGKPASKQSDIFSLGVVLFELFASEKPFDGRSLTVVKAQITEGEAKELANFTSEIPPELIDTLQSLISVDENARTELSELILKLTDFSETLSQKPNWWQRRAKWQQGLIAMTLLVVMTILVKPIIFPPTTEQILEKHLVENKRIAVLPLKNINNDPQIKLFSQGLAVTLSNELGKIGRSKTNSWIIPSAEIAKLEKRTLESIRANYAADYVLTGSIQHLGSKRLINLELVDGKTGVSLNQKQLNVSAKALFQSNNQVFAGALDLLNWPSAKIQLGETPFDGAYKHYITAIGYQFRLDRENYLDNAITEFKSAIALDSTYLDAYLGLINVYFGKYLATSNALWLTEVESAIHKAKTFDKQSWQLKSQEAYLLVLKGRAEEAITLLKTVREQNQNEGLVQIELATAYQQLHQYDKAEQSYLAALKLAPNNWLTLNQLGRLYFRTSQFNKAIDTYSKMQQLTPENYYPYMGLSGSYYGLGKIELALENAIKGNEIKPTNRGYSNIGGFQFYLGQYEESVVALQNALKISNTDYITWGNLGDSLHVLNRDDAMSAYQTAAKLAKEKLALNKQSVFAKYALAYYLARIGEGEQSAVLLNDISDSNISFAYFFAALSYDIMGNQTEAIAALEKAIIKGHSIEEIVSSPLWSNLHTSDYFESLVKNNVN